MNREVTMSKQDVRNVTSGIETETGGIGEDIQTADLLRIELQERQSKEMTSSDEGKPFLPQHIPEDTNLHEEIQSFLQQISEDDDTADEIRVLLIGKTGVGKNMTANTILGKDVFESSQSVTQKLQHSFVTFEGKRLVVVNTPGCFDTYSSDDDIRKKIKKSVRLSAPGLHAIILVADIGNFTREELDVLSKCRQQFGDHMENHLIILFTGLDNLQREGKTIENFLADFDEKNEIKEMLRRANNRYIAFDNYAQQSAKKEMVRALKNKIEQLIQRNDGKIFTNQMYKEAEEAFQEKKRRKLQEMEVQMKIKLEKQLKPFKQQLIELQVKTKLEMDKRSEEIERNKTELEKTTDLKIKILRDEFQRKKEELNEEKKLHENGAKDIKLKLEELEKEYESKKTKLEMQMFEIVENWERGLSKIESDMHGETLRIKGLIEEVKKPLKSEHKREVEELREKFRLKTTEANSGCCIKCCIYCK